MKRLFFLTYFILLCFKLFSQSLSTIYIDSARLEVSKGSFSKAIGYINRALDFSPGYEENVAINDLLSSIFYKKGNYFKAIHYKYKAIVYLELLANRTNDTAYYDALYHHYIDLAALYEKIGELNTAIDYYLNALSAAYMLDNRNYVAEVFQYIAKNYHYQGDYEKALDNYQKSMDIFEETGNKEGILESLVGIAKVYKATGAVKKSIEVYLRALELARKLNKDDYSVIISSDLAYLFYNMNLYDVALKFSDYSSNLADSNNLVRVYNLLLKGKVNIKLGNYSIAEDLLDQALSILSINDNPVLRADVYSSLGDLYLAENDLDKAHGFILRSYNIYAKLKSYTRLARSYYQLGEYYSKTGDLNKAKVYYTRAEKSKHKDMELVKSTLTGLAGVYERLGDYKKANELLRQLAEMQDSIIAYNQLSVLEKEKIKQEGLEKLTKVESELQETKRYNTILIVLLALLLFILLWVGILIRSLNKKNEQLIKQKKQIQQRNEIIKKQIVIYKRLSLVASHTENSIFIISPKGVIIWVNKSFLKLYGYKSLSDVKGKTIFEISSFDKLQKIIVKTVSSHKPVRYLNKSVVNGRIIWVQTVITPIIRNDRVVEFIGIESDVTSYKLAMEKIQQQKKELMEKNELLKEYNKLLQEQKHQLARKNEELLLQQEELKSNTEILQVTIKRLRLYSIVLNEVNNIIYMLDVTGNVFWVNKAFTVLTGYNLVEFAKIFKKNITNFKNHSPIEEYFYEVLTSKKPVSFTSWLITKNNKKVWLQTSFTPIMQEDGDIEYVVVIETDITKLKETEEKLARQHKEIRSSIEYASRIQSAILPMPIFLEAIFANNYFIYNSPRDIVSGDFYWAKYVNGKILFAVADATGHGIPGAFMSILGIMALNLVFTRFDDTRPNKFLSELKDTVIHLLHQRGKSDETRDSMDIALCIFDFKQKTVDYSGAYIPLYLVRRKEQDNELVVKYYPADNTTIGYDEHENIFTAHRITLQEGDMIYITTDGYLDQFGGEKNKKFKRKRFMKLLKDIYDLPVSDQKLIVQETFEAWKGDNFQVDDVLVFGLKIDRNLIDLNSV